MQQLIASMKGKSKLYTKVLSKVKIFDEPDEIKSVVYDPNSSLDENEWYHIEAFKSQDFCTSLLKESFSTTDYQQLQTSEIENVDYIIFHNNQKFYFQRIGSGSIVKRKLIGLKTFELKTQEPILIINDEPDAIYIGIEDRLYFKNLHYLTRIFKGIDTLFRAATDVETQAFLRSNYIALGKNYSYNKVMTENRKRIVMAVETLKNFSDIERENIFEYVKEYCGDLTYDHKNKSFAIGSEKDLRSLLWGIEQRYYTTKVGGEKRVAQKVAKIPMKKKSSQESLQGK